MGNGGIEAKGRDSRNDRIVSIGDGLLMDSDLVVRSKIRIGDTKVALI